MTGCFNRLMLKALIEYSPLHKSNRFYGRWMHRSPAKVLLPPEAYKQVNLKKEKIIELDPSMLKKNESKETEIPKSIELKESKSQVNTESKSLSRETLTKIKKTREENLKKQKFYLSQQKVFDDSGNVIYEKLNDNDSKIGNLLVKVKSKKERSRSSQMLVEGWRLIADGLEAKCNLKYVIFSRTEDLNNLRPFLPKTGVKFYKIPYKEMQLWSTVQTAPGIFGIFETPTPQKVKILSKPLPLQIICDNIRDPGNMGAILRVAVGAGCEKILLSKGCVDIWEPKVIRSAAGAHFRLPIYQSIEWSDMTNHLSPDTSIYIADSNTSVDESETDERFNNLPVLPYYSVEFSSSKHTTLILGGETEGVSADSYVLTASKNGVRLNIPLHKGVNSLNSGMAIAVIAFEIRKQIIQELSRQKLEKQTVQVS